MPMEEGAKDVREGDCHRSTGFWNRAKINCNGMQKQEISPALTQSRKAKAEVHSSCPLRGRRHKTMVAQHKRGTTVTPIIVASEKSMVSSLPCRGT